MKTKLLVAAIAAFALSCVVQPVHRPRYEPGRVLEDTLMFDELPQSRINQEMIGIVMLDGERMLVIQTTEINYHYQRYVLSKRKPR